jgi:hypothetical protein
MAERERLARCPVQRESDSGGSNGEQVVLVLASEPASPTSNSTLASVPK